MMRYLVLLISVLAVSCTVVPPELASARPYERQMVEYMRESEVRKINAYDHEVRRLSQHILDLQTADKWRQAANPEGLIPVTVAQQIAAQVNTERDAIMAQWEAKREEFLKDPTRQKFYKLHDAGSRYINALDSMAREIDAIIGTATEDK